MKKSVFIFVVGLSAYFRTADAETVWLRDVTRRFQSEKRTLSDPDLPDQLSFRLKRKSHALTLNLKRNHQIDPNADVYIVRKLKDGRSLLAKTRNLEKEVVAYYQDMENGASMTARCVKRSSGQCDILINGNIRIGDRYYDLRPSEADVTSRNVLGIMGLLAKRYVLQDQANIQREMSVENKDEANVNDKNVEENFIDLLRRIPHEQDKQKHFLRPGDKIRNNGKEYYVEVFIMTDSSIWDLFTTMSKSLDHTEFIDETIRNIRQYFSHIINGVDLLYKGIEDTSISITVIIRGFLNLSREVQFQHRNSRVEIFNGRKVINADNYLDDLSFFDINYGSNYKPEYDHVILFTKHVLYRHSKNYTGYAGLSNVKSVCDIGKRVQLISIDDYYLTVTSTAHELGHSLGAVHDGDTDDKDCKAEDMFIMSSNATTFEPTENYSRNPWLFSNCSVEAFKNTLKDKKCVTSKGNYTDRELSDWNLFMMKLPGELYTPNDQCHLINGPGSTYCGNILGMICKFMYCTHPRTRKCMDTYFSAATGTTCGINAWCKEGLCVLKRLKKVETKACSI